MPRKENPATRADPTPGKGPMTVGDRGTHRPAAGRQNERKVAEAGARDADAHDDEPMQAQR